MEKITFRGRAAESQLNKRWFYGDIINYASGQCAIVSFPFSRYGYECSEICRRVLVDPHTVGVSTGIADTNGKTIYEGDIVLFQTQYREVKGVVKRDNANPSVMIDDLDGLNYEYDFSGCGAYKVTVLGNIHDNPELLGSLKRE